MLPWALDRQTAHPTRQQTLDHRGLWLLPSVIEDGSAMDEERARRFRAPSPD
jgi:hypothetical protein